MEFVKEGLAFTGDDAPMANLMPSVMGAFAEAERALILARPREESCLPSSVEPTVDERNR